MVLFKAIESILTVIIMIGVGYYLTSKKWFDNKFSKTLAKLVTCVALPALMFSEIMGNFTKQKLIELSKGLIAPIMSIVICYVISVIMSKVLRIQRKRRGTFQSMFFNSNTIFIGLPVNMALFGTKSISYVLLYYIANTTFFWTLGVFCISKDSPKPAGKILSIDTVKRIVSPPLLGFIFAVIFVLINVRLPKFMMDVCNYFGDLTTPLSMIFIGISIYSVKLRNIKLDKDMIGVILGRFVVSPLVMFLIIFHMNLPILMKEVFIMQSAMPVMTNAPIIAKAYDADSEYAAVMVTLTTMLSMITIPIFMALF